MTQPNLIDLPPIVQADIAAAKASNPRRVIKFRVDGEPKPQPRARSFVLRGKGGKPILSKTGQPIIRVHEAGTAENWKSQIALAAKEHCPFPPISGPIRISIEFCFPRPKAHYKSSGWLKESAPYWHVSRGDFDNLAKAVTDAITVLGMWDDDSQLCDTHISKYYEGNGHLVGASITIEEL